ncbi:MAG: hypothetical protein L6Q37_12270 [Bdellovibrionaceae bacterium]|nr:hypothetical protein [Pseudobdellovibrionaceae bacterium]NUM57110.1 hypothetical protein [Pseudobdellovibrionaceae bacterium]
MKHFININKNALLYSSLFAALAFSVSGTTTQTEGQATLAAEAPPTDSAAIQAKATPSTPPPFYKIKPNEVTSHTQPPATTAVVTAKPDIPQPDKPQEQPKTATVKPSEAPVETVTAALPVNTQSTPQEEKPKVPAQKLSIIKVEYDSVLLEGTRYSYKVTTYNDGSTELSYEPQLTEGSDCSNGICRRDTSTVKFAGGSTAADLADIKRLIREDLSHREKRKDATAAKTTKPAVIAKDKVENEDSEEVDDSKGTKLLKTINTLCDKKSKEAADQIECKVGKFMSFLNKKLDKQKNKIDVTDDEALDFFTENIKDGLKEMLTHKFSMPLAYNDDFSDRYSMIMEFNEEKATARKEKDKAVKLIKELLRNLGAKYKDVRKEVTSLYKEAVKEQAKEALTNYRDMKVAEKNKDILGTRYNFSSFMMNNEFLKSMDQDLFSGILSGMSDSRNLVGSEFFNKIIRELTNEHNGFCRSYNREIGLNVDSCGSTYGTSIGNYDILDNSSINGITNSSRTMNLRGNNSSTLRSGTTGTGRVLRSGTRNSSTGTLFDF